MYAMCLGTEVTSTEYRATSTENQEYRISFNLINLFFFLPSKTIQNGKSNRFPTTHKLTEKMKKKKKTASEWEKDIDFDSAEKVFFSQHCLCSFNVFSHSLLAIKCDWARRYNEKYCIKGNPLFFCSSVVLQDTANDEKRKRLHDSRKLEFCYEIAKMSARKTFKVIQMVHLGAVTLSILCLKIAKNDIKCNFNWFIIKEALESNFPVIRFISHRHSGTF